MILLNLGCGYVLPKEPWINIDQDASRNVSNYRQIDLNKERFLPWETESVDGIMANHAFEHFDAIILARILKDCYRMLKVDGVLRVVVPDASYFRKVYKKDNKKNARDLFGEPLAHPEYSKFMDWALFLYEDHRQIFTEDSLWCTIVHAGFNEDRVYRVQPKCIAIPDHYCNKMLAEIDNRPKFSLVIEAYK